MHRSYSDKYVPGSGDYDLFKNANVVWLSGPYVLVTYVLFVMVGWAVLHISEAFTPEDCWTVVNLSHGLLTFILFHWIKGCPDDSTQGEYNAFTFYEQMDAGTAWTGTKKVLMLVPTIICWLACHLANYKIFYVVINCSMFLICIIAKIPQMHGVRLFGINSTLGIDAPVEYNGEGGSMSVKVSPDGKRNVTSVQSPQEKYGSRRRVLSSSIQKE